MSILEDLYPKNCTLVIDVLRQADIDTADWTANDDPSRRNNWSFGKDGEPQVLFIWHDELYMDADRVCYDASMQEHAICPLGKCCLSRPLGVSFESHCHGCLGSQT